MLGGGQYHLQKATIQHSLPAGAASPGHKYALRPLGIFLSCVAQTMPRGQTNDRLRHLPSDPFF